MDLIPQKLKGKVFYAKMRDGFDKYDHENLYQTINNVCSRGLITNDQKMILLDFKEKYRNAYSHSEKRKIFQEKKQMLIPLGFKMAKLL